MRAKGPKANFKLGAWPLMLIPQQIPNAVHVHLQPHAALSGRDHAGGWGEADGGKEQGTNVADH